MRVCLDDFADNHKCGYTAPDAASRAGDVADGVVLEVVEIDEFQRGDVGGGEDDGGRHAGVERVFPAADAEAPAVAGDEAGEIPLRDGGAEVVPLLAGELQELGSHADADGVQAGVAGAGLAETVAVETGHGGLAAALEFAAEDVGLHGWLNKRSVNKGHAFSATVCGRDSGRRRRG